MDDKNNNNELIDFSNQPLGIMAQEGEKIEENLNKEYQENEAKRAANANVSNVQENPFLDISPSPDAPAEVSNNFVAGESNGINIESPNNSDMANLNGIPASTPSTTQVPINNNQQNNVDTVNAEEQRKEELMNELTTSGKNVEEVVTAEEQPGSWGIFVFIILIAIVAGAFVLFKTGKIDQFFTEEDEEKENVSENTTDKGTEEPKKEEQTVQPSQPETIKYYHVKETSYLAAGQTITITTNLDVDVENMVGHSIFTVNYVGVTSRNVESYYDYNKKIVYTNLDMGKYHGWYYDGIDQTMFSLEDILQFVQSLGTPQEISTNNYRISIIKL